MLGLNRKVDTTRTITYEAKAREKLASHENRWKRLAWLFVKVTKSRFCSSAQLTCPKISILAEQEYPILIMIRYDQSCNTLNEGFSVIVNNKIHGYEALLCLIMNNCT